MRGKPCGGPVDWGDCSAHRPYVTVCERCERETEHDASWSGIAAIDRGCQLPAKTSRHNRHVLPEGWEPPADDRLCGTGRFVLTLAAAFVAGLLATFAVMTAVWGWEQAARAWGLG